MQTPFGSKYAGPRLAGGGNVRFQRTLVRATIRMRCHHDRRPADVDRQDPAIEKNACACACVVKSEQSLSGVMARKSGMLRRWGWKPVGEESSNRCDAHEKPEGSPWRLEHAATTMRWPYRKSPNKWDNSAQLNRSQSPAQLYTRVRMKRCLTIGLFCSEFLHAVTRAKQ